MTPEGKVKKDIKDYLKSLGPQCRFFMPQNMGMGESGVADFIGVNFGRAFALEAKRAETEGDNVEYATPWQFRFLSEWRAASGLCGVVRSVSDVQTVLGMMHVNDRPIDPLQPNRTE